MNGSHWRQENESSEPMNSNPDIMIADQLRATPRGYPEEKLKSDHLAPLEMTPAVRWSLFALRAYLILMIILCFYHVIDLATHMLSK